MPNSNEPSKFTIENAQIIFRNFSGKESQYNKAGDRNFCVVLTDDVAAELANDGWNIKTLNPREVEGEEAEPGTPYIQVKVNFKNRPPKIVLITNEGRTRTPVTEDMVDTLDWADMRTVDLIANGYDWEVGGKTGTKAYLKTMFVTLDEDELERKYAMDD